MLSINYRKTSIKCPRRLLEQLPSAPGEDIRLTFIETGTTNSSAFDMDQAFIRSFSPYFSFQFNHYPLYQRFDCYKK